MTDTGKLLLQFSRLPRFKDGRIDYTHAKKAPVITCFVRYKDRILLLKRSGKVMTNRRKWNTVAGYLDEPKTLRQKALEELREEAGIKKTSIRRWVYGKPFTFTREGMTWMVHPMLAELKHKPGIMINWEHTNYRWIMPEKIREYDIVKNLPVSLAKVLAAEKVQKAMRKHL